LAQKLTFMNCTRNVPDSNLSLHVNSPDILHGFHQSPQEKLGYFLKLRHDRLVSYSFNFAIGDHPNKQAYTFLKQLFFLSVSQM